MSEWYGIPVKYNSYRLPESEGSPVVASLGKVLYSADAAISRHAHASYQLVLINHGECNYSYYEKKEYLKSGSFCFARPGEFHEFAGTGKGHWGFLYMEVNNFIPSGADGVFWRAGIRCLHNCGDLVQSFEEILRENRGLSGGSDKKDFLVERLFSELAKRIQRLDIYSGIKVYSDDLVSARNYVFRNVKHGLSPNGVASCMGVRESRLRRRFADELSISIGRYIKLALMNKAENLLRRGDTVSSVAEKLGFPSVQYFSAAFKRCIGVCPTRFQSDSRHKLMCPISW